MTYIAQKKLLFDRFYEKGEIVPSPVIDPAMLPKLICYGLLQKSEENTSQKAKRTENKKEPKDGAKAIGIEAESCRMESTTTGNKT